MEDAYLELAGHAYQQGDMEEAERWWRKAAEEHDSPEGWYNLGVSAQQDGDYSKSVTCLLKTLDIHPGHQAARLELAKHYIMAWGVEPDLDWAEQMQRRVLAGEKDDSRLWKYAQINLRVITRMREELPGRDWACWAQRWPVWAFHGAGLRQNGWTITGIKQTGARVHARSVAPCTRAPGFQDCNTTPGAYS